MFLQFASFGARKELSSLRIVGTGERSSAGSQVCIVAHAPVVVFMSLLDSFQGTSQISFPVVVWGHDLNMHGGPRSHALQAAAGKPTQRVGDVKAASFNGVTSSVLSSVLKQPNVKAASGRSNVPIDLGAAIPRSRVATSFRNPSATYTGTLMCTWAHGTGKANLTRAHFFICSWHAGLIKTTCNSACSTRK